MPFEERASTAPLTRRDARRAPAADEPAAASALTRRQRRDVAPTQRSTPSAGWQPRQIEAEVVPPTTVQVEVVGPVVPEPSAPSIIEPVRPAAVEPRPVEPRPLDPRLSEPQSPMPSEPRPAATFEPRPFTPRVSEPRAFEPLAAAAPVEPRPSAPIEPRLSTPIESRPAEAVGPSSVAPAAPQPPVARRVRHRPSSATSESSASGSVAPATRAIPTASETAAPAVRPAPIRPIPMSFDIDAQGQVTSEPIPPATRAVPTTPATSVRSAYTPIVPDPVVAEPTSSASDAQTRVPTERSAEPARPRVEASAPAGHVDEFERAARLFSFTGETPTISTSASAPVAPAAPTSTAPAAAPEVPRTRRARRITAASLSLVGIAAVGLLTVGMTLPSQAVAAATGMDATGTTARLAGDVADGGDGDIQAFVASAAAAAGSAAQGSLQHSSGFSTGTQVQLAGTDGISNVSNSIFNNNANCPVQWPFAVGVPISYGFGPRPGEFHEGADFTPGDGAHIQAIADGVVVVAQDNYQGYGTAVIIDHVINGQRVASLYGHMQYDSMQVHVGQKVKVGEYIGRTGNTGHSFGAHTHVEIRQNDVTPIDPVPWLRSHNVC